MNALAAMANTTLTFLVSADSADLPDALHEYVSEV